MVDFCFQYRLMTCLKTKTLQYSFDKNLKKDTKTSKSCSLLSFTFANLPYVLEQVNVEKTRISASIASSFQQRPKAHFVYSGWFYHYKTFCCTCNLFIKFFLSVLLILCFYLYGNTGQFLKGTRFPSGRFSYTYI